MRTVDAGTGTGVEGGRTGRRRTSVRYPACIFGLFAATALAALFSPATAQEWVVPRTPDGRPDFQGNWSNATITPFERPEGQEPVISWDEVERLEGRAAERLSSDADRPPAEAGGRVGGSDGVGGDLSYNVVYLDRGDVVAVVDGEPRSSLLTRPANGRVPPLTPEGERRAEEYREFRSQFDSYDNPETRPFAERCIVSFGSNAGPPMLPNGFYNNNYTIVQTPDHVMIHTEMVHDTRVIRLGEPRPLPPDVRPWFGDSWGHWEGDTLVVETRGINPDQRFRGGLSENARVIERFTRPEEETLLYEFTIDDPTTYTEPWGGEVPFKRFDDLVYEYACHEGNYALENILSGARYQDSLAEPN
jgi:hypothetical protein